MQPEEVTEEQVERYQAVVYVPYKPNVARMEIAAAHNATGAVVLSAEEREAILNLITLASTVGFSHSCLSIKELVTSRSTAEHLLARATPEPPTE